MTFCPKCGKEVSSEASYCPSCGASLRASLRVDKDLLHEKIVEARHNEIAALITGFMGIVMILAGLYIELITTIAYHPYVNKAIIFVVLGLIATLLSGIIGTYYRYQRKKLMKQLESLK